MDDIHLDVEGDIHAYIQVVTSGRDRNNHKKHRVHQFKLPGMKRIPEPESGDFHQCVLWSPVFFAGA